MITHLNASRSIHLHYYNCNVLRPTSNWMKFYVSRDCSRISFIPFHRDIVVISRCSSSRAVAVARSTGCRMSSSSSKRTYRSSILYIYHCTCFAYTFITYFINCVVNSQCKILIHFHMFCLIFYFYVLHYTQTHVYGKWHEIKNNIDTWDKYNYKYNLR